MLHRIDVAIFDVTGVIRLIPDQMLPEAALPDAAFVAFDPDGAEPFSFRMRPCEAALDEPPTSGEIGVAWRKGKDCMEMVWQNDESVDGERAIASRGRDRKPQKFDVFDQKALLPFKQIDSEEPASTGDKRTTIIGHAGSLAQQNNLRKQRRINAFCLASWTIDELADYASLIRPTGWPRRGGVLHARSQPQRTDLLATAKPCPGDTQNPAPEGLLYTAG